MRLQWGWTGGWAGGGNKNWLKQILGDNCFHDLLQTST